jgi:hypothetical protein
MKRAAARQALFVGLSFAACAPAPRAQPQVAPMRAIMDAPLPRLPTPSAPSGVNVTPARAPAGRACGALDCRAFATPGAAFDYVLESEPRVLAVGEAHAQAGTPGIASSTRRFAEQLLPKLAGKAKHLVIELLLANCERQTTEAVKEQQAAVTEHQAKSNQNEFVTLGKVAQRLGIEPQGLTPDCPEYEAVAAAGESGIARLLTVSADQSAQDVETLLTKTPDDEPLVIYGGALHNDLNPRPGQESWSFGPRLATATRNRYLELDLIVPEFVKDSEAWRNLPWFAAFDREHLSSETLLYQPAPHSFVLIFPKTERSLTPAAVR